MLKHVVMWRLNSENKQQNAQEMKRRLEALADKIEGVKHLEVGLNAVPSEQACDIVLLCEFADVIALERYQQHPAHQEVVKFIRIIAGPRQVVDFISG